VSEHRAGAVRAPLRWVIVGTGWACSRIAAALERMPDARLAGVVSRDRERGAAFATTRGCDITSPTLAEAIEQVRPDIVYVGSPNAAHVADVGEALGAGIHVLADKPLALTVAEAEALRDEARRKDARLGLNLQVRKHPALASIVSDVRAGRIGTVVRIDVRLSMGLDPLTGWRADPELAGGGSVHNLGAHALDTLLVVADATPRWVSALQWPPQAALDLTTSALVDFGPGPIGSVTVSQATVGDDVLVELSGTTGRIRWSGWLAPYRRGSVTIETGSGRTSRRAAAPDAYLRLVRDFQASVRAGRDPEPGADAGVTLARLTEAIVTSARTHRTVAIA
jgi:1,5-anhydro-D-fructose reductase (1,5-anhydro-D-mannitol-forming)